MSCEIADDFPFSIREVEHETIQLSDGVKLAVRYWLPLDAESNPVPAILEYIPYCKRDGTAARDEAIHPYFAGHGYAAIRVDIRGSGESEGVLLDEYLKLEQDDAIEVIAWIADQPWCNGRVGMMGKSWGGFNGLQVAARQPDALKCIITVFFTDDRYADDVHYIGGCLALENPMWAFAMFPALCRPPDPVLVGDSWREMWMHRLEACRPWTIEWMKHQRRDAFWKHGSVCENFNDIQIPVYAIGGWADPYSNPVPRVLAGLDVPRKGLIGPWGHYYMHEVIPGPQMGFMDEALRWWDHWLKQKDTGIMDEPRYRVWVQDSIRPHASHQVRPGYWASEPDWPSSNIENYTFYLGRQSLQLEPDSDYAVSINSPQTTGQCMPFLGNMGAGDPQDPVDQRPDDAMSVCFDGPILEHELSILGAPQVSLNFTSDQPNAFLCVRLNELLENGESLQVTYGILNLTHRNGHECIEDLIPGKNYQATINLNDIAHTFASGSRIRLSISNACWPLVWPSPKAVRISLFAEQSIFKLPVRAPRADDLELKDLPPAKKCRPQPQSIVKEAESVVAESSTDWKSGKQTFTYATDTGTVRFDQHDWAFSIKSESRYSIHPDDPNSAKMESCATETYGREGQLSVRIEARQSISSDENNFYIAAEIEAYESDIRVFSKQWDEKIDRDGV